MKVGNPLAVVKEYVAPAAPPEVVRVTDCELPLVNVTATSNEADCPCGTVTVWLLVMVIV